MPIDPSIPLSVRPPQQPALADLMAGTYRIKQMQDEQRQRQQQMEEADAVKAAVQAAGGDLSKALPAITRASPATGLTIGTKLKEAHAKDIEVELATLKRDEAVNNAIGRAFVSVRDDNQEDWNNALGSLNASGIPIKGISPVVNNQLRDSYVQRSMDIKDTLSERRAKATEVANRPKILGEWLDTVGEALGGVRDQNTLDQTRALLKDQGAPESVLNQLPTQYDEEAVLKASQLGLSAKERADLDRESKGSEYTQALNREARRSKKPLDQWTRAEEMAFRKEFEAQNDRVIVNTAGEVDIPAIGDAIIEGLQPPTLAGLYRNAAPVRSYLATKKFNLADAESDWRATQRFIQSANNNQQLRMRQAVDNAFHSLDTIEAAAKAWDGGRFPDLNKAALAVAEKGNIGGSVKATIPVYNKDTGQIEPKTQDWTASQIARLLKGQIADVTSELGNVYMGGNSPTDHALKLAGENLAGEWSKKDLLTMVDLSRTNLKTRSNSMTNVGMAVGTGRYLPGERKTGAAATPTATPLPAAAPIPQVVLDRLKGKPPGSGTRHPSLGDFIVDASGTVVKR